MFDENERGKGCYLFNLHTNVKGLWGVKWLFLHQEDMVRFTMVLKSFVWSSLNLFVSSNCLFLFAGSLQKCFARFLLKWSNGEIIIIKHFRVRKRQYLPYTLFIRAFQGYRCKSGITIFSRGWGSLEITQTNLLNQSSLYFLLS